LIPGSALSRMLFELDLKRVCLVDESVEPCGIFYNLRRGERLVPYADCFHDRLREEGAMLAPAPNCPAEWVPTPKCAEFVITRFTIADAAASG
jgi:hypothetical protein